MRFTPTAVGGVWIVDAEPIEDARGSFARVWAREELSGHGLVDGLAQCSLSRNRAAGTLRGLHYQRSPFEEAKVVRCTRGGIYDVAVDLRRESPSFRRWVAVELTAANGRMLYVPQGCAHGFQTLADDTDVLYFISVPYSPEHAAGVRWDDPAFGIEWPPASVRVMSERDRAYPDFVP